MGADNPLSIAAIIPMIIKISSVESAKEESMCKRQPSPFVWSCLSPAVLYCFQPEFSLRMMKRLH
uniref:Putative ovule protein n=1 Tax=Solanum chacoense TaxID=4108 RepID=A0A0V0GIH4_SOLCH